MKETKVRFMKVYLDFYDYLTPNEVFLLSYLLDVRPIVKRNNKGYYRVSASFLQDRTEWTIPTIKKYLSRLEERNLIKIHHVDENNLKSPWMIEFLMDNINKMFIDVNADILDDGFLGDNN